MSEQTINRREFIYLTAASVGTVGVGFMAWPFIHSMNPSADVQAVSQVDVDLSSIPVGQSKTVFWRGKPIFISHRNPQQIQEAQKVSLKDLKDPENAMDEERTKKPDWLVVVGVCTHLGCVPNQRASMGEGKEGGWYCPCHGSYYDTSGRVRGGPAPRNLEIPPYEFINDNKGIRIG